MLSRVSRRVCFSHIAQSFALSVSTVPAARLFSHTPLLHPRCPMVSSFGRVQHVSGAIVVGSLSASGYRVTRTGGRSHQVHRLVAAAFLGPPPTSQHCQINHKDGDRTNNHLTNLEYATPSQNVIHSFRTSPNRKTGGLSVAKPVLGRPVGTHAWDWYPSMSECARQLRLHNPSISACCRGLLRQTHSYEFKFANVDMLENAPDEEWRQAVHPDTGDCLSNWMVSSMGRVKSSRTHVGWGSRGADRFFRIYANKQALAVHRLVARVFIGPPPDPERRDVNHIDCNRGNNEVCNLQWASRSESILQSYKTNRTRSRGPMALRRAVIAQHLITKESTQYPSMNEAARRLSLNSGAICACCHGKLSKTGMYTFRFAEEEVPKLLIGEEWRPIR